MADKAGKAVPKYRADPSSAGKALPKRRMDSGNVTASQKGSGREHTDPPISSGKSGKGENLGKTGKAGKSTLAKQKTAKTPFKEARIEDGKSGKGENLGKTGKAGKSTLAKQQTAKTAIKEARIEDEIPKDAKCLMDCEAAIMLGAIQEQLQALAEDPTVKIPKAFDQGLLYAKSSSYYSKPDSVKQVREVLNSYKLSDVEICLIGNTCPETVDEVYSLVPSLKGKALMKEEATKDMLATLAKLKDAK